MIGPDFGDPGGIDMRMVVLVPNYTLSVYLSIVGVVLHVCPWLNIPLHIAILNGRAPEEEFNLQPYQEKHRELRWLHIASTLSFSLTPLSLYFKPGIALDVILMMALLGVLSWPHG